MRSRLLAAFTAALVSVLPASLASAEVTKSESFETSQKTSLKILEPAGAHVFVTAGTDIKDDTVPAIFALPNQDAFVVVKVVMPDGEAWSGKVEVKARRQTVVRFAQTKKAGGPAPKFTGRLTNNTDRCHWPENVKFVVSREGQQVFSSQMVFPGKEVPLVLEKGSYLVQVLDTSSTRLADRRLNVGSEGWTLASGCVKDD